MKLKLKTSIMSTSSQRSAYRTLQRKFEDGSNVHVRVPGVVHEHPRVMGSDGESEEASGASDDLVQNNHHKANGGGPGANQAPVQVGCIRRLVNSIIH